MPALNWDIFAQLPGSVEFNFEMLCRALIRRHYNQYGDFVAQAAQPGVEFYLKLHTQCSLGESGRCYGWQCRWYDLPSGRAIGTPRRNKIEKAIKTTEKNSPNITDWVLWTRYPLTKGDQNWFNKIKTHMRLHMWTAAEVEAHLSGEAEILRGTYFGELVLTPSSLDSIRNISIEPIRRRWQPELHQTVDAERELHRMLGEKNSWINLVNLANQLRAEAIMLDADAEGLSDSLRVGVLKVAAFARSISKILIDTHTGIEKGDLESLQNYIRDHKVKVGPELSVVERSLRSLKHSAALSVTNTLEDVRCARDLINDIPSYLGISLVAILADAGCGKTQLSAQLTEASGNRPAGILLLGRELHARQSLDDLAHRVVIQGRPVTSIESLLAAVDAAGQRAHHRIPIIIDGLNEAEDPRDWKYLLASMNVILQKYPYVLGVCTLRKAFEEDALPSNIPRLDIPNFGDDTNEAIEKYFTYYRINPADADLPYDLLSHPLTLRLFCEVTNPTHEREVGIEAMPRSLTGLFEKYLELAAVQITELAPRNHRYYKQDVLTAYFEIGVALWEDHSSSLDERLMRRHLHDDVRPWNESIIYALEQEGVILRAPGDTPGSMHIMAVYDALGGHLVADAILAKYGRLGFEEWLKSPSTTIALFGQHSEQHPLAIDTFKALIGLTPRRIHQQMWQLLENKERMIALQLAVKLEGAYLDTETVSELNTLLVQHHPMSHMIFHQLYRVRGVQGHPLNADFLDTVLHPMPVADRDLQWTEWIRVNSNDLIVDLHKLEKSWRNIRPRTISDFLRARWVMWTLTSTVRMLRDQATRTLYWFGRGDSNALFKLALDSLSINDMYIPERVLAVSYGLVMAHQLRDLEFADNLQHFIEKLQDALVGPEATNPTNHWLSRLYVQSIITLAQKYYTDIIHPDSLVNGRVPFASGPIIEAISSEEPRAAEVHHTIHMDFENYTIGRLFRGRRNYDMNHDGHKAAVDYIRGMIWALGWRATQFDSIDKAINNYVSRKQPPTERYGKKYGWIGFYSYAGILEDNGQLNTYDKRLSDLQIDPSFPEPPPVAPINVPDWARPTPLDDKRWVVSGIVTIPDELLYSTSIESHSGPWIAVDGFLQSDGQAPGRKVFGFLKALLVMPQDVDRLIDELNTKVYPGNYWIPETPMDHYTFAGEIPWNPEFACIESSEALEQYYRKAIYLEDGSQIEIEILSHGYDWESYHSAINNAGGSNVPSKSFSTAFDLRGIPQTFNQVQPDGSIAALSYKAPEKFTGDLLYLREDLVHRYADGRRLIWFVWGERELNPFPDTRPDWFSRILQNGKNIWRHIRKDEELSRAFVIKVLSKLTRGARKKP